MKKDKCLKLGLLCFFLLIISICAMYKINYVEEMVTVDNNKLLEKCNKQIQKLDVILKKMDKIDIDLEQQ